MSPWLGAAPLKLKPMTENTPSMSGSFKQNLLRLSRDRARVFQR